MNIKSGFILQSLFCLLCVSTLTVPLHAQVVAEGVKNLAKVDKTFSFMFRDSRNTLWLGHGNISTTGKRFNNGLGFINSSVYAQNYTNGIFTDAVELDSTVYFAAYDGLYLYGGTTFVKDDTLTENACLEIHNSKVWIGTMGHGLFEKTANGYRHVDVIINSRSYDSIYSLKSDGSVLWIGSSRGLIKYDGSGFELFEVPVKFSNNPTSHRFQKIVADIEIDKNHQLWALTRNQEDSLECLFYLDNKQLKSALALYKNNCNSRQLIPRVANGMDINRNGYLIVGMIWGVLVFEDVLKPLLINDNYRLIYVQNPISYSRLSYVYQDVNDQLIVSPNYSEALIVLDLLSFKTESVHDQLYKTFAVNQININEIKATVANDGNLFSGMDPMLTFKSKPVFDIPNLGCAKPMYTSGLWMGGMDMSTDAVHLAAQTYRLNGSDYFPGPINLLTGTNDSVANVFYNRIWKIDRKTIEIFKLNYTSPLYKIPQEIMDWPAHGNVNFTQKLAPFVDLNANGRYEPLLGEYPDIKGDQMLWWVFNDLGKHNESNFNSLGIEIHGSCYAFYHKDLLATDTNFLINQTLFFNYKLINRSKKIYKSFYTGLFNDVDLGNYRDDFIGCDTVHNAGFGYNGDNYDELPDGFGLNPPMILCKFLNNKMTNFYEKGNLNWSPENYYRILRSSKAGDSSYTSTGFLNQGYPCNNPNNTGANFPGDRRFMMSTNTPVFKSDSAFNLEFAYVFLHKPTIDFLKEGCDEPKQILRRIQTWYENKSFPSKPYTNLSAAPRQSARHSFELYPNPASKTLNLHSDLLHMEVFGVKIIDAYGRTFWAQDSDLGTDPLSLSLDIASWPRGVYYVRLNTLYGSLTKPFIKT